MIIDSWRQKKRLPYKLRCYKRISSPAKSRNNTREKISLMNEWQSLHDTRPFVRIFRIMAVKTLKKSVSLTASDIETFLETGENQNMERKTESFVFSGFGNGTLVAENEIAQLGCLKGNLKANIRNI